MSLKLIIKAVLGLLAIYLIIVGILLGLNFSPARQAYILTQSGKNNLQTALSLAQAKYWPEARRKAQEAQEQFSQAEEKITIIEKSLLTAVMPLAKKQTATFKRLLLAAQNLSEEAVAGIDYLEELNAIFTANKTFSQLNKKEKRRILAYIYGSDLELAQIKLGFDQALNQIETIDFWGLLFYWRPQIIAFKSKLSKADRLLAQAVPESKLGPIILGYPQPKTFLFLLQNSDELRSTGGFIGTYGILKTDSGDIKQFETHDIYHLDMPVKDKLNIVPPPPIAKYLNKKWYLRDANWAPDFPTTAKKALWFFNQETKLAGSQPPVFAGIVAITPQVIIDLLKLSGPIIIEGQEYNDKNFTRLLEYRAEKGYVQKGISSWQRKEVIGQIAKALKIKLFDLPLSRWGEVLAVGDKNIRQKNILFYFVDKKTQALAQSLNATGEIKPAKTDYLLVVDFNMAAYKTDAVIKKNIYYQVSQKYDGSIAHLRLTYEHQGEPDWRTTQYKTYTRVYVPAGSKLLAAGGVLKKDVYVGKEFGKTFFGAYFTVNPGKIGYLNFDYQLPPELNRQILANHYELLCQKQPGSYIKELAVDLNFKNKIQLNHVSLPPDFIYQILNKDQQIIAQGEFNSDLIFKVNTIKKD